MSEDPGAAGFKLDPLASTPAPTPRPAAVHDRSLLAISWPVMITLAVGISGPIIDSWFLSRVSDDAAAGVGATLPGFVLLQTMLNALGQAGAGVAGQYLGARQPRLADATFTLMVTLLACGPPPLSSRWQSPALSFDRWDLARRPPSETCNRGS